MTHILDEQIHTTAILDAQAHAGRVGKCADCDGEGRTPNGSCTGDTAGGWADTCDTCGGSGKTVSLPNNATPAPTPVEETRACLACGGAHIITKCPAIKAAMDEAPGCVQPLAELAELRGQYKKMYAYIERLEVWLSEESTTTTQLRSQLARAHTALGGIVSISTGILECLDYNDPWTKQARKTAAEQLRPALAAARKALQ
jgi:hypothetical protein